MPTRCSCSAPTSLPQFFPADAKIAQVDLRPENLGRRCKLDLGLVGDIGATIKALLPRLKPKRDRAHLDDSLANYKRAREGLDELATGKAGRKPIHPQYLAKIVSDAASEGRDLHLRRRHADDLGGALPQDERPPAHARVARPWFDGQRPADGDRGRRRPTPAGR